MRGRKIRKYDQEFRDEAVALVERTGRAVHAVARDLGLPTGTLRNWYLGEVSRKQKRTRTPAQASIANGEARSPEARLAELEAEVKALRRRNEQLEMDREILKKAAAFFAKESE